MKNKQDILQWIVENQKLFTDMSDAIWEKPETIWHEFFASKLQADFLEAEGFSIKKNLAGMKTAFLAEWGTAKPILGFAGEYDALHGLSQKNQTSQEPVSVGSPGHGCGHNLLGTACLASAVAVKKWLETNKLPGTVRYYGCPAEEGGNGKTFMAREGLFDDLDAAFNFHPMYTNMAMKGSMVGIYKVSFNFQGKSAHAGGSPHLGRSALDAVELMNVGVNYLREHVLDNVRMHYIITKGGDAPNIVPAEAESLYFIRAHQPDDLEDVYRRVKLIAEGAALMTETEVNVIFRGAASSVLSNHVLADLQYDAMQLIGPIEYTPEEIAFAEEINNAYPKENMAGIAQVFGVPSDKIGMHLIGENFPSLDEGGVMTGSTDVGDMSRKVPLSMLLTACWPTAAPAHSWGVVATGAMSIGHKGMLHAAKTMALAAMDCFSDPQLLAKVRQEFEEESQKNPYQCPIPDDLYPPQIEEA
ncbi:MAG: amidohydrolase [Anaerolineaceae bacterium]|nr:amidohydrolase [Anaerolineaceae bacterium]